MTTPKNQSNVLRNGEPYITTEELRGVRGVDRMTEAEVLQQTGQDIKPQGDPGSYENFEFDEWDAYTPPETDPFDFDGFTS